MIANPEPELAGQTVVVIGGSSGMGLETARRARPEDADVVLTVHTPERFSSSFSLLLQLSIPILRYS